MEKVVSNECHRDLTKAVTQDVPVFNGENGEKISIALKGKYWSEYFWKNAGVATCRNIERRGLTRWTIISAFDWAESDQGQKYWEQVNKEYIKFYESCSC